MPLVVTAQRPTLAALAQAQLTSSEIVGCLPLSVDATLQSLEEPHQSVFGNTGYKPDAAKCSELLQ